ncbi:MAG: glycosyltransferase family 4 protein [Candidatus Dormibacteria bacterium]
MTALRVLYDGRALYDRSSQRGVGGYLWELLTRMGRDPAVSAKVLVTPGTAVPEGVEAVAVKRRFHGRLAPIENEVRLAAEVARIGCDVFHNPSLEPPRALAVPWVQTLYDIIPLVYNDRWFRRDRRKWRRRYQRIRGADGVVSISRSSADDAVRVLRLDPARVTVIPIAAGPQFVPAANAVSADNPYILYVSVFGPHKGYREALELVSALARRGLPHRLEIVGHLLPWWNEMEVRRLVSLAPRPDLVDLLGGVSREQLVRLYQGATALVVTSRYEGFGLPAVEAMRCATPVVAFANSSLLEVVGEGGTLVRDGDVEAMAEAVTGLALDPQRRAQQSRAAERWAARFDWDRCAARHRDAYLKAAAYVRAR